MLDTSLVKYNPLIVNQSAAIDKLVGHVGNCVYFTSPLR